MFFSQPPSSALCERRVYRHSRMQGLRTTICFGYFLCLDSAAHPAVWFNTAANVTTLHTFACPDKKFRLVETRTVQFRSEFFNLKTGVDSARPAKPALPALRAAGTNRGQTDLSTRDLTLVSEAPDLGTDSSAPVCSAGFCVPLRQMGNFQRPDWPARSTGLAEHKPLAQQKIRQ